MNFYKTINSLNKQKSVKYGIPFLLLMVGASFALKEFTTLRYQFSKKETLTPKMAEKFGIKMKQPKETTLESEFEKMQDLDIEHWENKRGPRPWEEEDNSVKS